MDRLEVVKTRVLTVQEVSRYLRVHPSTIYRMLKKNQLPRSASEVIGASPSRPSISGVRRLKREHWAGLAMASRNRRSSGLWSRRKPLQNK